MKYTSAASVLDLYDYLEKLGCIEQPSNLGFSREDLTNPEGRIPVEYQHVLWRLTLKSDQYQHIGLEVGSQINENAKGMLSHLISHTANVKEAIDLFKDNFQLLSQSEGIEITYSSKGCRIEYSNFHPGDLLVATTERSLSAALYWCEYLTHRKLNPTRIGFPYPAPQQRDLYEEIFGQNIAYQQENAYIEFSNEALNYPIISSNEYLKNVLIGHIEKYNQDIQASPEPPLLEKLRSAIEENLGSDTLNSENMAKQLHMSRQTLHRHLKSHNSSFQLLLNEVRMTKTKQLIKAGTHIDDISFQLGYKDTTAFYRAFKNWFDCTPSKLKIRDNGLNTDN